MEQDTADISDRINAYFTERDLIVEELCVVKKELADWKAKYAAALKSAGIGNTVVYATEATEEMVQVALAKYRNMNLIIESCMGLVINAALAAAPKAPQAFAEFLQQTGDTVKTWPAWKQNILGRTEAVVAEVKPSYFVISAGGVVQDGVATTRETAEYIKGKYAKGATIIPLYTSPPAHVRDKFFAPRPASQTGIFINSEEKKTRIKYQDTVYAICNFIDGVNRAAGVQVKMTSDTKSIVGWMRDRVGLVAPQQQLIPLGPMSREQRERLAKIGSSKVFNINSENLYEAGWLAAVDAIVAELGMPSGWTVKTEAVAPPAEDADAVEMEFPYRVENIAFSTFKAHTFEDAKCRAIDCGDTTIVWQAIAIVDIPITRPILRKVKVKP